MTIEIIVATSFTEKSNVLKYIATKDKNFILLDFGAMLPSAVNVQDAPWELIEDALRNLCSGAAYRARGKSVRILLRPSHFSVVSGYFRRRPDVSVEIYDGTPADALKPFTEDWNAHRDQVQTMLRRAQASGIPYVFIPKSCHSNTFFGQSGNERQVGQVQVVKAKDRFKGIHIN